MICSGKETGKLIPRRSCTNHSVFMGEKKVSLKETYRLLVQLHSDSLMKVRHARIMWGEFGNCRRGIHDDDRIGRSNTSPCIWRNVSGGTVNIEYSSLSNRLIDHYKIKLLFMTQQLLAGQVLFICRVSLSHSDKPHSVGLLWTSYQPDVETSTLQHTTNTRDRRLYPQEEKNPQSQQASSRRPMP